MTRTGGIEAGLAPGGERDSHAPSDDVHGRKTGRVEGRARATGQARSTADFAFANIADASLVQSEMAQGHGGAASLRRSAAGADGAPGMLRVMTPLNFPQSKVLPRDLTCDLPFERRPPRPDLSVQHVCPAALKLRG